MNDMIKKIIDINEADLKQRKIEHPVFDLKTQINNLPKAPNFYEAFEKFGIIAEIKLASPSAGDLADRDQVLEIASEYKKGGADAISIITERHFFKGEVEFITKVKDETGLPILQKDFVVDDYQIYESRLSGADALLLIAKIVSKKQLKEFVDFCFEIGLEPVVEVNDVFDLENALESGSRIIAVNARDLDTFKVDLEKASELLKRIPDNYLKLGFSGVSSKGEVEMYKQAGVNGVLIGTALMKSEKKKEFLEGLR